MTWKDVGSVVGKAAPVIGGLLCGPVGAAAGELVANVLGVENTANAVQSELAKNPDAYVKLKTAEIEHKGKLAELALEEKRLTVNAEIEHRRIDTADIQEARTRDIEIRKQGQTNTRADMMILGDVLGLVVCLAVIYALKDATGAGIGELRGLLTAIAGYFGLGLRDAHQFEFGSSRGSKEKDFMMTQKGA
jgi:hypothetical protein